MSVAVDMKALFEAGVHFGHKTSRWHPKMAPYIHSKRQDSHIIDLAKTAEALEKALPELTKIAASGKKILFVGTKKQVRTWCAKRPRVSTSRTWLSAGLAVC